MTKGSRAILALLALFGTAPAARAAEQDQLKAAIVYNIIRFTRFVPPPAQGGVRLCVLAQGSLGQALAELDGKAVPDGRLLVRMIGRAGESKGGCTIVFVGEEFGVVLDGAAMTIGDAPDFAARGGTVGLTRFGRQISFELNAQAGATRGVRFSSSLLNLAALVRSR